MCLGDADSLLVPFVARALSSQTIRMSSGLYPEGPKVELWRIVGEEMNNRQQKEKRVIEGERRREQNGRQQREERGEEKPGGGREKTPEKTTRILVHFLFPFQVIWLRSFIIIYAIIIIYHLVSSICFRKPDSGFGNQNFSGSSLSSPLFKADSWSSLFVVVVNHLVRETVWLITPSWFFKHTSPYQFPD